MHKLLHAIFFIIARLQYLTRVSIAKFQTCQFKKVFKLSKRLKVLHSRFAILSKERLYVVLCRNLRVGTAIAL